MRSRASGSEIRTQPPVAPEPGGHIPGLRETLSGEKADSCQPRWPSVSPGSRSHLPQARPRTVGH